MWKDPIIEEVYRVRAALAREYGGLEGLHNIAILGGTAMGYLEDLRELVCKEFNCTATHIESVPLFEQYDAIHCWKGIVEVFALHGYPEASKCYAWSRAEGKDIRDERFVVVGHIPPNDSPLKAVQAVLDHDITTELEVGAKHRFKHQDVTLGPVEQTTMGDLKNEQVQRIRHLLGIQDANNEDGQEETSDKLV